MSIINKPGVFIAIEGPDGSGKSTAARGLAAQLRTVGVDVVETRNIGGSPTAEKLRELILDPEYPLDPVQQNMLISVARRANINEVVIPALDRGAVVIADRFVASTLVFQTLNREGTARVTDQDVIKMHQQSCYGAAPDITLHVHAPPEIRAARRAARAEGLDRFDNGDAEYDRAIAEKYHDAGRILGHHTVNIDGSGDPASIISQMLAAVAPLAQDRAWSILAYRPGPGRAGAWHPLLDLDGRVYWTIHPHEANRFAIQAINRAGGSLQTRFVQRSYAIRALHGGGMSTSDADKSNLN